MGNRRMSWITHCSQKLRRHAHSKRQVEAPSRSAKSSARRGCDALINVTPPLPSTRGSNLAGTRPELFAQCLEHGTGLDRNGPLTLCGAALASRCKPRIIPAVRTSFLFLNSNDHFFLNLHGLSATPLPC